MQMPPTNRRVTITGINIVRVDNGVIAESWSYPDLLGLMQQLGAASEPGP
jgi:predicted ester cyclase